MYNLLRKDLLLQKKTLLFAALYSIFIFFAFAAQPFTNYAYIMGGIGVTYILLISGVQVEYKNHTDVLINSLPVKRSEFILSKYLSLIIFTAITIVLLGLIGGALKFSPLPFPARFINWIDVLWIFASVAVLLSIYLPIFYKFGGKWVQIGNVFLFMAVFFAPGLIMDFMKKYPETALVKTIANEVAQDPLGVAVIATAVILALVCGSLLLTSSIYLHKDL